MPNFAIDENNIFAHIILKSDLRRMQRHQERTRDPQAVRPYFPGEDKQYNNFELRDWVNSNLRFPKAAVKKGILKRRVVVDFVVCADGSIKNASVSHWDEDAEEYFKQEALRLVNSMPRWIPGTYKGKAVNAYASRPIWFEYDPKTKKQKVRTPTNPEHLAKEPVFDTTTIQSLPAFDPGEE